MTTDDTGFSQRLIELFGAASLLPPDQRGPLIEQAATESSQLTVHLVEMLQAHDAANAAGFWQLMASTRPNTSEASDHPETSVVDLTNAPQIPRYRIEKKLGSGGMGTVWLAYDIDLKRRVAIKQPQSQSNRVRFAREAQTAASLKHPNLCQIHDTGEQDGQPFIVMEFLDGPNLGDWMRQARPSERQSARVIADLARALAHAHEKIVHRDIKPSNIIMTCREQDGGWVPMLTDFGCAKHRESEDSPLTHSGQVLGTLKYMAPEQLDHDRGETGSQSDLYSLGLILYELLTEQAAFSGSQAQILYALANTEPPSPSSLVPSVNRDLEAICLKAIAKLPANRYASAELLAVDLELFLDGKKPVGVKDSSDNLVQKHHPDTTVGPVATSQAVLAWPSRATRWGLSATLLAVLAAAVIGGWMTRGWNPSSQPDKPSTERVTTPTTVTTNFRLPGEVAMQGPFPGLIPNPKKVAGVKHWQVTTRLPHCQVTCLAWHPQRDWLAMGLGNGEVRIYDVEGDRFELVHLLVGHTQAPNCMAWSVDRENAAELLATGSRDHSIRLWNFNDRHRQVGSQVLIGNENSVSALAWSPDGKTLMCGETDGSLLSRIKGRFGVGCAYEQQAAEVWKLAWHPNGNEFAVGCLNGTIQTLNLDGTESGAAWKIPSPELHELAFDETGQNIVWTAYQNDVYVRNRTEKQSRVLFSAPSPITGCSVDRSRRKLAIAGDKLRIWDHWTEQTSPHEIDLPIPASQVLNWSPDGKRLALAGNGVSLQIWDERTQSARVLFNEKPGTFALDWDADGTRLATVHEDGSYGIWSRDGYLIESKSAHLGMVEAVQWSPDGNRIATGCSWSIQGKTPDKSVRVWTPGSDQRPVQFTDSEELAGMSAILAVSWTSDGQHVVLGRGGNVSPTRRVQMFHAQTGRHERDFPGIEGDVLAVACHPKGKYVAAGSSSQRILIWDVTTNDPPRVISEGLIGPVQSLAWDSKGDRLAYACKQSGMAFGVIDANTLQILWSAKPSYRPGQVAWSPDDQHVLVGLTGIYAAASGNRLGSFPIPSKAFAVAWGKRGLIACNDYLTSTLSVVDPQHGNEVWLAIRAGTGIASFTPDGRLLDSSDDALAELRVLIERNDGTVTLEGFDHYPVHAPKPAVDESDRNNPTTVLKGSTPDRRAAEWALSLHSPSPPSILIRFEDTGREQVISQGGRLSNKPFKLLRITAMSAEEMTDDAIAKFLAPLNELQTLGIDFCFSVTEDSVPTFKRLSNLRHIGLTATQIRGAACIEIYSALPLLTEVFIHADQFTSEMADYVRSSTKIGRFGIHGASDSQVRKLLSASHLAQLLLFDNSKVEHVESATWRELPDRLTNLEVLGIIDSRLTDADLAEIARCPKLQQLHLRSTPITDKSLLELQKRPTLRGLDVTKTKVTEAGVRSLHEHLPRCRIQWDGGVMEPIATTARPEMPQPSARPPSPLDPPSMKPATESAKHGFIPLFNGTDLTGWKTATGNTGHWKVVDGAITCAGFADHLYTVRNDFGDFHLRAEVKINETGNSGIYFRAGLPLAIVGDYEAQISNRSNQPKTGSLYNLVNLDRVLVQPDTWFVLEIIAQDNRLRVLVNGEETANYVENREGRRLEGYIALQHHDADSVVHFRKIEIAPMRR